MTKFLDTEGLRYFYNQIKSKFAAASHSHNNMKGATSSAAGTAGFVPAPAAGMQDKFLCADATWKDAGDLPVGHEFFTTNPNIPAGCLPLLGGEYSRTTYADLWAWVQTQAGYLLEESAWQSKAAANGGNVPFYSKGDGSTTFRVPALKCWVRGANSIDEVGGYLAAGLPNITGNIDGLLAAGATTAPAVIDGAFRMGDSYTSGNGGGSYRAYVKTSFDASRCSNVYGDSDTVQPPSAVGLWLVKAYGTVTNVGSTDVSKISTGLTQTETRISALENHGAGATVVKSYTDANSNWYRVWSDCWLEQGGILTDTSATYETLNITLLKPFVSVKYNFIFQSSFNDNIYAPAISAKTTTAITIARAAHSIANCANWYACGQGV